ncbi:fucose 4-O-acetylase-like acetyltransferase [Kineosphaera limosa]|uniref:Acyltransferase 3 domain-containing protein n=1 Tax=Kineosphaera limosa NBRC 100340 TaxID=1184609 RepID=K6WWI2_9MICO|nr:acyltransferase [Kineosphaera limosa]NYE01745.1 fucose 4-O-acetylase-like acetyltransferase [Kineosphaera limosa]GAB96457.1 hypothetical protein KILIM_039_00310 [Kineosphaera limosa NBRC 100340]
MSIVQRASDAQRSRADAASPPPATASTPPPRMDWIDMSRAVAVVAVVLFHASIGHYYLMEHSAEGVVAWWDRVNQIVTTVRMPLLFAISGMLAAGKIRRGFRGGRAIEAAVTNYYLYVVWLLVFGAMLLLAGDRPVPFRVDSFSVYLQEFYQPNSPLWYVFALAIYLVAFTALRRVHPGVVLGGLLALHLVSTQLYTLESPLWTRALSYSIYFGLGVYGKQFLTQVAARPILASLALASGYLVYQQIGMTKLMSLEPPSVVDAFLTMALYVLAGIGMVGITGMLSRARPWAVVGRFIGKHTLGIYVLHIPVIVVINLGQFGPFGTLRDLVATSPLVDVLYPLIITAIIVPICIACQMLAPKVGLGALFAMPAPLRRQTERARVALAARYPVEAKSAKAAASETASAQAEGASTTAGAAEPEGVGRR